ncbi:uncharacterized protein LOC122312574 [Carya illinoinensis]|uniref:uncharacterized protein LOC122312574 n=1 Tax=Carya illinoinensis TaxID=32201 RepID=UPI001C722689|nr:uncharacterized protein LOC122312574 [Carya illinoinensis]
MSVGLGTHVAFELFDLVKREDPDILFLQETRLKAREFEVCKFRLGFSNCLAVDCHGRKGGITLLWGRDVQLSVLNYSHCHIDATVDSVSRYGVWFLTGVYGYPEVALRDQTWELLRHLCRKNGESWLVLGDFNEVLHHHEKLGGGGHCVLERLDRALVNEQWGSRFAFASVVHGLVAYSDHVPIWILTDSEESFVQNKKQFRFESMWVGEKGCDDIISSIWRKGDVQSSMDSVVGLIKESGVNLNMWNSNSFGNVQKKLSMAKQKMAWLQESDPMGNNTEAHDKAHDEVQKSLAGKITASMNEGPCKVYIEFEVSAALSQMHPEKAPGLDGMSPLFYQKYWHLVGPSVIGAVLQALNSGVFPTSINHAHITLVPKKKLAELVADYRPISLCNVIYKLVAKVISNRLKAVLPSVIEKSQCAFVPGHLITDNVLITYELIHFLKHKRKGKKGIYVY